LLPDQKCWLGTGNFDADGHNIGRSLADQIRHGLDDLRDQRLRIARPSRRVQIAKGRGWLLLRAAAMPVGVVTVLLGASECDCRRRIGLGCQEVFTAASF
jgi:hypothetical protein